MKLYVASPITNVSVFRLQEQQHWRTLIDSCLPIGWVAHHPIDLVSDIVNTDLKELFTSQAVLALVSMPSWGVAIEIREAWKQDIPVIGWWPHWSDEPRSPWLMHHLTLFTTHWDQVYKFLEEMHVRTNN